MHPGAAHFASRTYVSRGPHVAAGEGARLTHCRALETAQFRLILLMVSRNGFFPCFLLYGLTVFQYLPRVFVIEVLLVGGH